MIGKSAHGRNGKVGYYEHGWSTIESGVQKGPKRPCVLYRVPSKELEPLIWSEVEKLLVNPKFASDIISEAYVLYKTNPHQREAQRLKQAI